MYGRAFPVGNVLFFFDCGSGLCCLPSGEGPLALLAVETLQNGRIEASGQTLDDFIRIDRSVDDFFLFVQVHLLFRPTAWSMGEIRLAKPQVWNERGGPCFAPGLASKFFCAECRNTRPSRPPAPNAPFRADSWAGGAGFEKTSPKKLDDKTICFYNYGGGGAWGGKFSLPASFFIRGRNRGGHTRPDSLCSRPPLNML